MQDQDKAKEQLVGELGELRRRNANLESAQADHQYAAETLRESREWLKTIFDSVQAGILVETRVSEGTTFTIYLPVHRSEPSPAPPSTELPTLPTGAGETILVVEDNAVVRRALAESLGLLNYRVLEVSNGQEALEVLEQREGEVALVLSDVVMPRMSGTALLHALRERGLTVRVVMLTGHPIKREMEQLRAHGMTDWLPKPPRLEHLAQILARALGNT